MADATVKAILGDQPSVVSIIGMGNQGRSRADEDEHCALYLRNLLEGRNPDQDAVRALVMAGGDTQKFFDESKPQYHPKDVELALQLSKSHFSIKVTKETPLLVAHPLPISSRPSWCKNP